MAEQMSKEEIIAQADTLLYTAESVKKDIKTLLSMKTLQPVDALNTLIGIIRSTEAAYAGFSRAGEQKADVVKQIWKELDEKYHLVDLLDKAIKLPGILEPFDGIAIRYGIDLIIKTIVTTLNQVGVFKH